jgi:DNA-directed RNA polymerase subunit alpha
MYRFWRELISPKSLQVDQETLTDTYGKFIAEPLERGFGVTLGNSLRRVLLSSIQGAAITAAKIEGAQHEFQTLPGIVEDVTDIILNLKEVILQLDDYRPDTRSEPRRLRIDLKGKPGQTIQVTARDIQTPPDVTILNPEQHIATLMEDGRFQAEFIAHSGRGYIAAERKYWGDLPVGTIGVDASFSPIKKVNYLVTNARVGQVTDHDKLTLEIFTNGSIKPEDSIAHAAKILREQLAIFLNFEDIEEQTDTEVSDEDLKLNEHLLKTVDELELSVRSANCLANANIRYIGELVQKSEQEMLNTKNFGRKSLKEIRDVLSDMGLGLGMKIDSWPPKELKEKERKNNP